MYGLGSHRIVPHHGDDPIEPLQVTANPAGIFPVRGSFSTFDRQARAKGESQGRTLHREPRQLWFIHFRSFVRGGLGEGEDILLRRASREAG